MFFTRIQSLQQHTPVWYNGEHHVADRPISHGPTSSEIRTCLTDFASLSDQIEGLVQNYCNNLILYQHCEGLVQNYCNNLILYKHCEGLVQNYCNNLILYKHCEGLVQNYCNYLILYKKLHSFAPSPRLTIVLHQALDLQ